MAVLKRIILGNNITLRCKGIHLGWLMMCPCEEIIRILIIMVTITMIMLLNWKYHLKVHRITIIGLNHPQHPVSNPKGWMLTITIATTIITGRVIILIILQWDHLVWGMTMILLIKILCGYLGVQLRRIRNRMIGVLKGKWWI